MDKNAAKVLAELREDHKNMALMINLLERESNRIYAGEEPDYELLQDVMHYMTVYPDAVHHPKEDRLYAELKAVPKSLTSRSPEGSQPGMPPRLVNVSRQQMFVFILCMRKLMLDGGAQQVVSVFPEVVVPPRFQIGGVEIHVIDVQADEFL